MRSVAAAFLVSSKIAVDTLKLRLFSLVRFAFSFLGVAVVGKIGADILPNAVRLAAALISFMSMVGFFILYS